MNALAQTYDAIAFRYEQGNGVNEWITLPVIQHLLPTHARAALEVSCGVGRVAVEIAKRVDIVWGIDISKEMIEYARRRAQSVCKPICFAQGDVLTFDFGNQTFDFVYGAYVTAYFDVPTLLKRLAALTRTGGRILIVGGMGGPGSGSFWTWDEIRHYAACFRFLRERNASINLTRFIVTVIHHVQFFSSKEWRNVQAWFRAYRSKDSEMNWQNQFLAMLPSARIEQITPKLACAIWDKG